MIESEIPVITKDGYGWGEETAFKYDLYLLMNKYPDLFKDDVTFPVYEYKIKKVYSKQYKEHVLKPYIITAAIFVAYIIYDVCEDKRNYNQLKEWINE
ncbi:hypothetical protein ACFL4H_00020 [Candidatus Neomarinimicrobiota bacterium]